VTENEKIFDDHLKELGLQWGRIQERRLEEAARKLYGHIDFKKVLGGRWNDERSKF